MTTQKTFWSVLIHAALQGIVWLSPVLLAVLPKEWMDLTLSGGLSLVLAWATHKLITS